MSGELIRWIGVSGCCFILGMNAAFVVRGVNLLWRWLFIGKGFLTTYIAFDIWFDEWHWVIAFAFIGIIITSFTLAKMWHTGAIPTSPTRGMKWFTQSTIKP